MAPISLNSSSPAELAFLHSSLTSSPPIRPDGRTSNQFRPLIAEINILPRTNGSARVCFADGAEALVGIKAEVETTLDIGRVTSEDASRTSASGSHQKQRQYGGLPSTSTRWVEISIEIPGHRDDDALPVFLSSMLHESFVADGELANKLRISPRWHWKLYVDVLLLSPPLSYPVPLLSLTIHLALLSSKLPALKSEQDEDPFFDDDWDASAFLYPMVEPARPSITLLVAAVGPNILFDPSRDEIAVADALLAVSLSKISSIEHTSSDSDCGLIKLLSIRSIDPPSKLTTAGVSNSEKSIFQMASSSATPVSSHGYATSTMSQEDSSEGLWQARRGGMPRILVSKVVEMCLQRDGVGQEMLAALAAVAIEK